MSFPSSFATQVAAIMDVLAKAAVAEITKLVEDGTVVLRLEMCRRDTELQELKRSLDLMEVELCKAQDAATKRQTEDKQERTTPPSPPTGGKEDSQPCAVYFEKGTADSPCKPQCETEQNHDMKAVVKHEPKEELAMQETTDNTEADIAKDDLIWSLPACSMFEKSSEQRMQTFISNAEQFSAQRNTEGSYTPSVATHEDTDDSISVPVKVEVDFRPLCMGSIDSEPVHVELSQQVSCPSASQDQCLEPALQLLPALPNRQSSTVNTEDNILIRNKRVRRLVNVWRTPQKLFMCSQCNKGFPRMSQLEAHKFTHQTVKPFMCLECGKSFTQKSRLKTHQSVHTGERPFSCKICGKMFSRQDNCLRHERFHSGLKPYSCGQCGKSFTVQNNLRIHQEIHLQGR